MAELKQQIEQMKDKESELESILKNFRTKTEVDDQIHTDLKAQIDSLNKKDEASQKVIEE